MNSALIKKMGLVLLSTALTSGAFAKDISTERALKIAEQAVLHCTGLGYQVAATVVDASGNTVAVIRSNGAGPHTIDASRRKAYTSASAKNKTSAMLLASQTNPLAQNLGQIEGFLLLGGGVPVQKNGMTIGAVGVGGAPSGAIDEVCAQAGIDSEQSKTR